jgi:hypothetical protein
MKTDRTVQIHQRVPNDFLRTTQNQVFDIFFEIACKNANSKLIRKQTKKGKKQRSIKGKKEERKTERWKERRKKGRKYGKGK